MGWSLTLWSRIGKQQIGPVVAVSWTRSETWRIDTKDAAWIGDGGFFFRPISTDGMVKTWIPVLKNPQFQHYLYYLALSMWSIPGYLNREHEWRRWLTNGCMATHFSGKAQVRRACPSRSSDLEKLSCWIIRCNHGQMAKKSHWDGLHLTTSYNILQHLKSNLEVTISSEMHLESQLNFWGAGPPGPVVWRSLVCGGARRISWEWWRFFGMTQTSQWNSQWKILNIGISSVYMH
jgi:hypothetical protein